VEVQAVDGKQHFWGEGMTKKATNDILREMASRKMSLKDDHAIRWLASRMATIETEMRQNAFIDANSPLRKSSLIEEGQMVLFGYSPATKADLMFWDEFPITIVLHVKRSGFLGLNLHYLPFEKRANFLNQLRFFVKDPEWLKKGNDNNEFFLTYKMAKNSIGLKDYRKCIKRYYFNRMLTRISVIKPTEWMTVPFFPLDRFKGMKRQSVWRIVESMYR
jgi:hypothetical protein